MAVTVLQKLGGFATDTRYIEIAHRALAQMQAMMTQYPSAVGQWLQALVYALSQPKEIAIVGTANDADTLALLATAQDSYRPFQVVALGAPKDHPPQVPLLQKRGLLKGRATAYVCTNFACDAPLTDPGEFMSVLERR